MCVYPVNIVLYIGNLKPEVNTRDEFDTKSSLFSSVLHNFYCCLLDDNAYLHLGEVLTSLNPVLYGTKWQGGA